jgi:hypothetical protein
MVRSVKVITEVTCDRCGYTDNWIPETPAYAHLKWGQFFQGDHSTVKAVDLCPSCTREIKDWIRNGR